MKKLEIALGVLVAAVLSGEAFAKTDQDGREWITASDIDKKELLSNAQLDKILKDYVILDNDIKKCYFPELWQSKDKNALDKLYEQNEKQFWLYTRIYYRLPYAKLPESILKNMSEGALGGEYEDYQLSQVLKKYQNKTSIKTKKDCNKIHNFVDELLTH